MDEDTRENIGTLLAELALHVEDMKAKRARLRQERLGHLRMREIVASNIHESRTIRSRWQQQIVPALIGGVFHARQFRVGPEETE
jgi:FtsZ-binding cell division protein ZapB